MTFAENEASAAITGQPERWGVWCIRSQSSMFGHAEAWAKSDGKRIEFATREEADARARAMFQSLAMSTQMVLSYSARRISP